MVARSLFFAFETGDESHCLIWGYLNVRLVFEDAVGDGRRLLCGLMGCIADRVFGGDAMAALGRRGQWR